MWGYKKDEKVKHQILSEKRKKKLPLERPKDQKHQVAQKRPEHLFPEQKTKYHGGFLQRGPP